MATTQEPGFVLTPALEYNLAEQIQYMKKHWPERRTKYGNLAEFFEVMSRVLQKPPWGKRCKISRMACLRTAIDS